MGRHSNVVNSWSLVFFVVIVTLGLYGYVAVEATREAMFLNYDDMTGADMAERDYGQEDAYEGLTRSMYSLDDGGYGDGSGFGRRRGDDEGYGDGSGFGFGRGNDGNIGYGSGRGDGGGFSSGRSRPDPERNNGVGGSGSDFGDDEEANGEGGLT